MEFCSYRIILFIRNLEASLLFSKHLEYTNIWLLIKTCKAQYDLLCKIIDASLTKTTQ